MKTVSFSRYAVPALLVWVGAVSTALAAGADTNAGVDIGNTATVSYRVGGVDQTAVPSNTLVFTTDRKINLTVVEADGSYTSVNPGQVDTPLRFLVTNLSNDTIDIRLTFSNDATNTVGPFGGTDDFDTSDNLFYLDDGDGVYEPGGDDTLISGFLDNVPEDGQRFVWVNGDIPLSVANGDQATGVLTAQANSDGTGGAANDYVESGSDTPGAVDTVLADGSGATDAARNGDFSARDGWLVSAPDLVVTKSSIVVTDPINCTIDGDPLSCTGTAKRIPGAVVEYCIDVNNGGAADADIVVISDPIPANTTFVSNSIKSAAIGTGAACDVDSGTTEDDDATGADETDLHGGDFNVTTVGAVTVRINPNVPATERRKASFRVTIQ